MVLGFKAKHFKKQKARQAWRAKNLRKSEYKS